MSTAVYIPEAENIVFQPRMESRQYFTPGFTKVAGGLLLYITTGAKASAVLSLNESPGTPVCLAIQDHRVMPGFPTSASTVKQVENMDVERFLNLRHSQLPSRNAETYYNDCKPHTNLGVYVCGEFMQTRGRVLRADRPSELSIVLGNGTGYLCDALSSLIDKADTGLRPHSLHSHRGIYYNR